MDGLTRRRDYGTAQCYASLDLGVTMFRGSSGHAIGGTAFTWRIRIQRSSRIGKAQRLCYACLAIGRFCLIPSRHRVLGNIFQQPPRGSCLSGFPRRVVFTIRQPMYELKLVGNSNLSPATISLCGLRYTAELQRLGYR
jgi:hypothetical protein